MKTGKINITTGISGDEIESSHMNASLHITKGDMAIGIDTCPAIPENLQTEEEISSYIKEKLEPLVGEGWEFTVLIGPNTEVEDDDEANEEEIYTLTAYLSHADFESQITDVVRHSEDLDELLERKDELESSHFLITVTDNDGKLIA